MTIIPFKNSDLPISLLIKMIYSASEFINIAFNNQNYWSKKKTDGTWLSEADVKASEYIMAGIHKLCPGIPVISEEDLKESKNNLSSFFLLDPIDGTNQFISGHQDFCVCLAFIDHGVPILGIILQPVTGSCWVGGVCINGSWTKQQAGWKQIKAKARSKVDIENNGIHIIKGLNSVLKKEVFEQRLNCNVSKVTLTGSALKMAYISEGIADIYLRIFPIKQWDIAAGHAILKSADANLNEIIVTNKNNLYIIQGYKEFKYGLNTQINNNNWASSSFCCAHNTVFEVLTNKISSIMV